MLASQLTDIRRIDLRCMCRSEHFGECCKTQSVNEGNKMGCTVTWVTSRTLGKQLATVLMVSSTFSILLSQVSCYTVARRKREDPCPKLEVLTSHGCQPCSMCDPQEPNFDELLIRRSCKEKHLDVVIQSGAQKLWCDNPRGPFPECPPLPEAVPRSCIDACKQHHRTYAPGCQCQLGCPGEQTITIECTRNLWWSNNDSIPVQCNPPSTTASTVKSTLATTKDLDLPISSPDSHPKEVGIPWHWLLLSGFVGVVLVGCGIAAVVFYWRKKKQPSSMTSSVSSSGESDKTCGTEKPLLGQQGVQNVLATVGASKVKGHSNTQAVSQLSVSQKSGISDTTEVEIQTHVGDDATPETEALLGTEAGDCEEKTPSQKALQALLNNRQALLKMAKLFDQKDQFDKVTWHNVAKEFVEWDADEIRRVEYMLNPPADCSPGDCFIYQVLTCAYRMGKGLLELLDHLENRKHCRHREAEQFLSTFWEEWQQKNMPGNQASC